MDMQRPARQIHDVTGLGITCANCGNAVTELPFQPTKRDDGTYGRIFCRDCNRARLSTEGRLYLCLFATHGHDLRYLLRDAQANDEQIGGALADIWTQRRDRYSELRSAGLAQSHGERKIEMHYIGG